MCQTPTSPPLFLRVSAWGRERVFGIGGGQLVGGERRTVHRLIRDGRNRPTTEAQMVWGERLAVLAPRFAAGCAGFNGLVRFQARIVQKTEPDPVGGRRLALGKA